jgi:hypothetical protein
MKTSIISAVIMLVLVSCERPNNELNTKISQLEKTTAEAVVRQRQLEMEIAEQKILTERDAIERERALIEQERIAMESLRDKENTAAANEFQNRQSALLERERKVSDNQNELDNRENKITGLETDFNERELDLAGREPMDALPPLVESYVSGPTGDFNNFYEPLGAYGSWFQTRDYGYVFQPWAVRDVTWRPYTQGRWAFTNQGWTWVSSEPFGWACYHYGRWALLRNVGWVWVPGTEWAPAWVTWRESTDHIGWAPLPPETLAWNDNSWDSSVESRFVIDTGWFSFISYRNFGNNIYSHCLPISQNVVICHNTTNITHYVRRNRCVFVGGPRYRNVCTRIGRDFPIHRLHLEHSPDFGRGGHHLSSKFSGNELNVVAPRMNAEWNQALRPSRVSRDLGDVVVDRTKELPTDIRQQYRDRKNEEDKKAQLVVTNAGGRESFEKERQNRLGKSREEVAKNELESRSSKNTSHRINKEQKRSEKPNDNGNTDQPIDQNDLVKDRNSKRQIPETLTVPVEGNDPSTAAPSLTDLELKESRQGKSQANKLPRGLVPTPPVIENKPSVNPLVEPPMILNDRDLNESQKRPQLPASRELELKSEIEKQAARESRQQQEAEREERLRSDNALKHQQAQKEEINRQQQLENRENQQKQEQLEKVQRKQQEQQEKLNQQLEIPKRSRDQKEHEEGLGEQQQNQEQVRKEQQERLLQQQAQQELAREQQEELQIRLREQQEQQRAEQEQQNKMRVQQEQQERALQQEAQRRAQEQQEQQRAEQEQQNKMRVQQEQQERARQQEAQRRAQDQQEQQRAEQKQQDKMRAQQEHQERARQQQEEAQRRAQEQQQQERMRAQQEQMERSRQQQEEAQRRNKEQQQEQQERSRQRQKN